MRRRDLLAGASGVLGALWLAGCNGLAGSDPAPAEPAAEVGTLTPAPVPTSTPTTPRSATVRNGACSGFPLDVGIVRCASKAAAGSIRLIPESDTYNSGSGPFSFTLHNDTALTFKTGRDRWVLAQRPDEEWAVVARGEGEDLLWVEPGGSFSWVLGGDATATARPESASETRTGDEPADAAPEPLEVAVGGGPHALAVLGAVPRGARTALIARFRIEPSLD